MFSRALEREEHCKQISLACVHSDSATLGLPPLSMCAFPVYTAQTLGCSAGNCLMQALVCMHFPGLRRSGSGSQVLHTGTDLVGPAFAPVPGLRSSGDQFLGTRSRPQLKAVTYPLPSPSRWFSGCITGVPCVSSRKLISGCDPPGGCQPSRIPRSLG